MLLIGTNIMSLRKRIGLALDNYTRVHHDDFELVSSETIEIRRKNGGFTIWEVYMARYSHDVLIICARRETFERLQDITIHRDLSITSKDSKLLFELFKIQLELIHSQEG
jgi:hypothetical protein